MVIVQSMVQQDSLMPGGLGCSWGRRSNDGVAGVQTPSNAVEFNIQPRNLTLVGQLEAIETLYGECSRADADVVPLPNDSATAGDVVLTVSMPLYGGAKLVPAIYSALEDAEAPPSSGNRSQWHTL